LAVRLVTHPDNRCSSPWPSLKGLSSGPADSPKTGVIDGELGDDVVAVADLVCQGCAERSTGCGWIAVIGGSSRMQGQTGQRALEDGCHWLGVSRCAPDAQSQICGAQSNLGLANGCSSSSAV
jgi:hypothetical protein